MYTMYIHTSGVNRLPNISVTEEMCWPTRLSVGQAPQNRTISVTLSVKPFSKKEIIPFLPSQNESYLDVHDSVKILYVC